MGSKDGRYSVKATVGMVLGKSLHFTQYEEASEFAALLTQGQPVGTVEVLSPEGTVIWSYTRNP